MASYNFIGKFAVKTPVFATLADQRRFVAPLVDALKDALPRFKGVNLDHISEDEFATILENEGSCPTIIYFSLNGHGGVMSRAQKISEVNASIFSVVESCGFSIEDSTIGYA